MPNLEPLVPRRASSGTATSAAASIRASPRSTISPPRSRSSIATAPAGPRSRCSPPSPRSSRWRRGWASSARPAGRTMTASISSRLLDTTHTDGTDWAYPRADETPVRAAPRTDAAVVDTTGPAFRPPARLCRQGQRTGTRPHRLGAGRACLDGKTGYVAPGSLMSLTAERLCYIKDGVGRGGSPAYVGGGD